jgi:hypothetical protein
MMMNPKQLIRDPKRIHSSLRELTDGRLVAVKDLRIYIPSRFTECGLASIGIETYIAGIYAIVDNDMHYGISLVNAMLRIEPTSTIKLSLNDEEYYEFYFEPGSTVISDVKLVKNDVLVYKIYNELIAKGHVPWYLGYLELGKLFDTAEYHAGANIGKNHEVTELLISMIARNPDNRHEYYRTVVKSLSDMAKKPPVFIGLKNVTYSATNTLNKLAGSYFKEGLVSALVSPTDRVERIEHLLRA